MTSIEITILQRFKGGLVNFIDELIQWLPEDEDLIGTRILINDQIPIEEIMKKFIEHIKPYRESIEKREEKFFLNDPQIFSKVKKQNSVLSLRKLWENPEFSKDDKNKAWMWMDFFIKCIDLYEKNVKKL